MRPVNLKEMTKTVSFDQLPSVFHAFIESKATGRTVVDIAG
jgi:hypothetical protein